MGVLNLLTKRLIFFIVACVFICQTQNAHTADVPSEYQVKAVFLYNFTIFVQWPPKAFVKDSAPIVIGILGKDPFADVLDKTVEGEIVRGRKLSVKRFKKIEDIQPCHIIFISRATKFKKNKMVKLLSTLSQQHVLTIGETDEFMQCGGIINFTTKDDRVLLAINVDVAKRAELKVSSNLLKLAEIVRDESR